MAHLRRLRALTTAGSRGKGRLPTSKPRLWRQAGAETGAGEGAAKEARGGPPILVATTNYERAAQDTLHAEPRPGPRGATTPGR